MKIVVTQEDIEKGRPCMAGCCPIALALRREGFSTACVWTADVTLDCKTLQIETELPSEARAFVSAFDRGLDVEPFEFDLPTEAH